MPDPFPRIAHAETSQGSVYIESPDCNRIAEAYHRLRALTIGPEESNKLVSALAKELQ